MLGWLSAALIVLVAVFVYLNSGADMDGGRLAYLGVLGLLGAGYLLFVFSDYRGRAGQGVAHALVWCLVFLALVTGYAFRGELQSVVYRVAGEVLPPGHVTSVSSSTTGEKTVRIRSDGNGHFLAYGTVNGTNLRLLVDTGASTVVLKAADAEQAGIGIDDLSFTVPVQTANGQAYAAPVRLREISIGPIVFDSIDALVAKPGALNESLLGMNFLNRLRSYEVEGSFMTLRG